MVEAASAAAARRSARGVSSKQTKDLHWVGTAEVSRGLAETVC